jgi:protein-disulfide isomerase
MAHGLKPPVGPQDHVQGDANAVVTLVEYGDYQCPYCGNAYPIVKKMQAKFGKKLRFAFRNFPLAEMHPFAMGAAEVAEAAALQGKFWEMHDRLYENQEALDPQSLLEHIRALHLDAAKIQDAINGGAVVDKIKSDFNSGVHSGVNGTPSFFINGVRFDGNWTDEAEFAEAIQAAGG